MLVGRHEVSCLITQWPVPLSPGIPGCRSSSGQHDHGHMPGPAKGRKSSSAPTKGKAAPKGSGHTHVQAETTTPRRVRRTRPPEVGGQQERGVDADRESAAGAPDVKPPGPRDRPEVRQDEVPVRQRAVRAGLQAERADAGEGRRDRDATGAHRLQGLHPRRHAQGAVPLTQVHSSQRADFKWTAAEKTKFGADFQTSVATAWSKKHELMTKDPTFAEHRGVVDVKVELVDAGKAHNTMSRAEDPEGEGG